MAQAKKGDNVNIHYTGTLKDGTQFDSSRKRGPLKFEIGSESVIPGFEKIVIGMTPGETKTATIPSDDAYGPRHDDRVFETDRNQLPGDLEIEKGQIVEMRRPDGVTVPAIIVGLTDHTVTFDANHPLAGQELTFEIELLEIL